MIMTSLVLKNIRSAFLNRSACIILNNSIHSKCFLSKPINQTSLDDEESKKPKKKTIPIPKITLLNADNDSVTVTTLEEAQNISKRRDLKLVKIVDLDTKTQRPIYKLMTAAQLHIEDLKHKEEKKKQSSDFTKGEKILFIGSGISDHDLGIHSKKILKWISKKLEVRIVISGSDNDMSKAEKIYKDLEAKIGSSARLVQKRTKNGEIKFQVIPPKDKNTTVTK